MNTSNRYAQDRIANEIDGWYSNLDFYLTAFGGDPDSHNVAICQSKIEELEYALEQVACEEKWAERFDNDTQDLY
tara:strand:+ start:2845 stop:3069 length:225 start_codon:yes stop_codon:yes gene_type:complete